MTNVIADRLPSDSSLWLLHHAGDFLDCYSVESPLPPREAARRALTMPVWARSLLRLRNALVRPFGLRTEAPDVGDHLGMFPIQRDDGKEFILGFDDRHLDFRIGVIRSGSRVFMATWVRPHNIWGRAYLRLVMPFHILISRGAVARMVAPPAPAP